MPKVLITVPEEELKQIDKYAEKEYLNRSQVFLKGAMDLIRERKEQKMSTDIPRYSSEKKTTSRCEVPYCKGMAVGKFKWSSFNNTSGEDVGDEKNLCEYHKNLCKGEVEKAEGKFEEI